MSTTDTRHPDASAASGPPPLPSSQTATDLLLGGTTFDPAPAATPPAPPHAAGEPAPVLRLSVKGLKPIERELLEGIVQVSQRRSPRLVLLDPAVARDADVVVVDARDAAAMAWAQQRPWLADRVVIWIDGEHAGPCHIVLRRPVQWPVLPMVLARALERGAGTGTAVSPAARGLAAAGPPHTARVLVVDDSLAVRVHLRSLLEPRGYQVTEADSVAAAMERIEDGRFDCVLMDVLMPQEDGYEGCHRIKARLRGAGATPVVMLSSKGTAFDRLRGKMAGCDAYLTKPADPHHLGEVLAQQVGGAAARAAPVVPVRRIDPNRPR